MTANKWAFKPTFCNRKQPFRRVTVAPARTSNQSIIRCPLSSVHIISCRILCVIGGDCLTIFRHFRCFVVCFVSRLMGIWHDPRSLKANSRQWMTCFTHSQGAWLKTVINYINRQEIGIIVDLVLSLFSVGDYINSKDGDSSKSVYVATPALYKEYLISNNSLRHSLLAPCRQVLVLALF